VRPLRTGKGLFLNLSYRDKNTSQEESYSAPVTWGEFAVIRTLAEYVIPRALGFDNAFPPADAVSGAPQGHT
jgi:hypothetical protein